MEDLNILVFNETLKQPVCLKSLKLYNRWQTNNLISKPFLL